jgi:hypothetical protein
MSTDRQVLMGLLALQNGIINEVQLDTALHAWRSTSRGAWPII